MTSFAPDFSAGSYRELDRTVLDGYWTVQYPVPARVIAVRNGAVTPLCPGYAPRRRTCAEVEHEPDRIARGRSPGCVAGAIAALAGGLAVVACGGSGATAGLPAGTGTNASNPQALAASQCMRAHGITNFPDPVKGVPLPGGG
jgi:hypothetical protein